MFERQLVSCGQLAAGLLLLLGCETGGPAFPDGDTLLFEATLAEQLSQQHDFAVTDTGTVRIEATRITATDATSGEPIAEPTLNVALGRPREESCVSSFTNNLAEGDSFSVFLDEEAYCLLVRRSLLLPGDAVVDYLLTLSPAFS